MGAPTRPGHEARPSAAGLPDEIALVARGFMESRILLSAVELDLFTLVGTGAAAGAVAQAASTHPRATATMLNALVAMGFLTKAGDTYACAPFAARFLAAGSPDDARAALKHNLSLWETWSTLTECVRRGTTLRAEEMATRGDGWTIPFIAAMHRNATQRAPLVIKAVGIEGVHRMLDVGGGSGAYSIAFAQAKHDLEAEIFDLATVLPIASGHVAAAGLQSRITLRAGDLRTDGFGSGFDLVLISAICHMLGPAENADLLGRARRALAPGGRVVIQDHVMAADGTAPRPGAIFAINMLVGTPAGGTYTEDEYAAWLRAAGFTDVCRVPLPGPNDLMIARRAV
jgi:SAM-dependent methyltransferase